METAGLIALLSSGSVASAVSGVVVILLMAAPFIVKFSSWSKEQSANGALYGQLAEQLRLQQEELKEQRKEIEKVFYERNELVQKVIELKARVEHLENCETTIEILKKRLDEKDMVISQRDDKIASLIRELLLMKDRVHNLELRLKSDEMKLCAECHSAILEMNK